MAYLWLATVTAAYAVAAVGYQVMRAAPTAVGRVSGVALIGLGSVCFAVTYKIGPAYRTIWFVGTGIGSLVGAAAAVWLARERFNPTELFGALLIVAGAYLMMAMRG